MPRSALVSIFAVTLLLLILLVPAPRAASASRGPFVRSRGRDATDSWQRVVDRDDLSDVDARFGSFESSHLDGSGMARRSAGDLIARGVDATETAEGRRSSQEPLATTSHACERRPDMLLSRMDAREPSRRRGLSMSFLPRHHPRRAPGTCWSRTEAKMYWTAVKVRTEASFLEALVEYRKMHARCVNGVKDWEAFFRDKDNGQHPNADVEGCKYLFWMAPGYAGLGNNLMSLISAMTYSLLTNRAIILAPGTDVASFLCNPFDDSNWAIPARHYK
ncbi:unnamed protein product [Closterium sp. Yama58-4]|nr:unnamed protein product [Closterium sp. Yama58-4]